MIEQLQGVPNLLLLVKLNEKINILENFELAIGSLLLTFSKNESVVDLIDGINV